MRTTEPTIITQGEQIEWTRSINGYPADEWTLQYRFRSNAGPGVNIDAVADDTQFAITMTAEETASLSAGRYIWQAWATNIADTTNIVRVCEGQADVRLGFSENPTHTVETRSANEIALASIDAAMTAFATSDVLEYEISTPVGTRRVKRSARSDLMNLRKYYAQLVSLERTRDRLRNGGSLMKSIGIVVRGN